MLILPNNMARKLVTVSNTDNDTDLVDRTIYTFSGKSIGAARGDRLVVVGFGTRIASPVTISTMTIGGNAATELVAENSTTSECWLYALRVPTGTTADIVIQFSGPANRCFLGVWAVYGALSATPRDSGSATGTSSYSRSTASQGGVAIGYCCYNATTSGTTHSSSQLTQDFSSVSAEANIGHWGGSASGLGGTRTYTVTPSPAVDDGAFAIATFR